MNNETILVLAGTGKTGTRVAAALAQRGGSVRRAARRGADVAFDWDDPATHAPALRGVSGVYLVPPGMRLDFADQVGAFLDLAVESGVRHVTYLSARGVEAAPPSLALRAVELDLAARDALTHSILRPAWFMQNFSESFLLPPILEQGVVPAPTGDGAEAFVDAGDIAAVAVATLLEPDRHAGQGYTPTGPEALTMAQAAEVIGAATGREIQHVDVPRDAWIDGAVESGVPPEYAQLLASLFDVIRDGGGASTTSDVELVTGRPPVSFAEYAQGAKGAWQGAEVSA